MLIDNFNITFEQVGQFEYIIKVVTPDKLTFTAPIQLNMMNDEIAAQIWEQHRKEFFLELDCEVKNDIIKV